MRNIRLSAAIAASLIGLVACGSSTTSVTPTTATVATTAVATTAAPVATTAAAAVTAAAVAAKPKVSANAATKPELIAAMEGAGIANASKWADEIIEYRPYKATDASLKTLSGELAKYNASPETITQIIGLLAL